MHPELFRIGSWPLHTYTALFVLGGLVAIWVSVRLARLTGMDRRRVFEIAFWAVVGGTVGAVLPELILTALGEKPGPFAGRWTQIGMIGAFAAGTIAARATRTPVLDAYDVCASGAALSHAIGRVGCFAGGCCWGTAFSGPWAVIYHDPDLNHRVGTPIGISVHPTQLYEAFAEAILGVAAYYMFQRPHRRGAVMATYLILSSAMRFGIEFLRSHSGQEIAGPLTIAQYLALAAVLAGTFLLLGNRGSQAAAPAG